MSQLEVPAGVEQPTGQQVTILFVRGLAPIIVDESYTDFTRRFEEFMTEEHTRGEQFHFTTFYTWDVEVNKLHFKHIKREPACFTLDGCRDVDYITTDYITVDPIEVRAQPTIQLPFAQHGPGKRH